MGPNAANRKIGGRSLMMISIVFVLFIMLFFLPFLPGIAELVRKEDADPLYIAMDYIKDPRYFGKSFKELLHQATDGFTSAPGIGASMAFPLPPAITGQPQEIILNHHYLQLSFCRRNCPLSG